MTIQTLKGFPKLEIEKALFESGSQLIAGIDEVGRGALAGPVSIGIVVLTAAQLCPTTLATPSGIRDSKQMTPLAREKAAVAIRAWAHSTIVAHASAQEIDKLGIVGALRLATHRGLLKVPCKVDVVLLDGNHDWLSGPPSMPKVITQVKGDQHSIAIAAASIVAKVERDQLMSNIAPHHPEYEWNNNKGYGSGNHLEALAQFGATKYHRRTWNLPAKQSAAI